MSPPLRKLLCDCCDWATGCDNLSFLLVFRVPDHNDEAGFLELFADPEVSNGETMTISGVRKLIANLEIERYFDEGLHDISDEISEYFEFLGLGTIMKQEWHLVFRFVMHHAAIVIMADVYNTIGFTSSNRERFKEFMKGKGGDFFVRRRLGDASHGGDADAAGMAEEIAQLKEALKQAQVDRDSARHEVEELRSAQTFPSNGGLSGANLDFEVTSSPAGKPAASSEFWMEEESEDQSLKDLLKETLEQLKLSHELTIREIHDLAEATKKQQQAPPPRAASKGSPPENPPVPSLFSLW